MQNIRRYPVAQTRLVHMKYRYEPAALVERKKYANQSLAKAGQCKWVAWVSRKARLGTLREWDEDGEYLNDSQVDLDFHGPDQASDKAHCLTPIDFQAAMYAGDWNARVAP